MALIKCTSCGGSGKVKNPKQQPKAHTDSKYNDSKYQETSKKPIGKVKEDATPKKDVNATLKKKINEEKRLRKWDKK